MSSTHARDPIRIRKVIVFLAALWSVTTYGQEQTGGIKTGYIVDASGGKHPVKISQTPQRDMLPALCGGALCFAQWPSPAQTQSLTDEQTKVLNSTYQPPQSTVPSNEPIVLFLPKPTSLDRAAAQPSSLNAEPVYAAPERSPDVYVNPCDAACQQRKFNDDYAVGQAIGSAIGGAFQNYRISSYCKTNPTSTFLTSDGISIPCPKAPLTEFEESKIADYCRDNPGSWTAIGRHRVDCVVPPLTPNLKWTEWEMGHWRAEHKRSLKANAILSDEQARAAWNQWQPIFCSLAPSGAKYKDLDGKTQSCH